MAEHPLEPHVLRFAGGLHLAGVVIVEHAVIELRDGWRGVHSLADVDELAVIVQARCRETTVGDKQGGNRNNRSTEESGGDERADHPDRAAARNARPPSVVGEHEREHEQAADSRDANEDALGLLRASGRDQDDAEQHRPDNRTDGVGGIDAADHSSGVLTFGSDRRKRQRKTCAPQHGGG